VRPLAENLDRAADLAIGPHERDKRGEARIQLEDASEPDASKDGGSVKRTVCMLDQAVFVVLRMPRVQHISTTVTSLFSSLLPKAKAAAKPLPPRTENCPSVQQIESKAINPFKIRPTSAAFSCRVLLWALVAKILSDYDLSPTSTHEPRAWLRKR
jgi:hypothetical protein